MERRDDALVSDLGSAPPCPRCGEEGYWLVSPPSEELTAGIASGRLRARIVGDVIEGPGPVHVWMCEACGLEWGDTDDLVDGDGEID